MDNRKLIRPELAGQKGSSRSVRRKPSPPDQTSAEEYYYLKQMAAETAMIVVLMNGEELEGAIEWYDKNAIKLTRDREPNLLIPKHNIRYMFKKKERAQQRRREARINGRPDSV